MRKKANTVKASGTLRLAAALGIALIVLTGIVFVIPWYFPYDRLEHFYGIEGVETIQAGSKGSEYVLLCSPINGSPSIDLLINGEVYTEAEYLDKSRYKVMLGQELFEQTGRLELTLRERFRLPIYLRSNTVSLYVVP